MGGETSQLVLAERLHVFATVIGGIPGSRPVDRGMIVELRLPIQRLGCIVGIDAQQMSLRRMAAGSLAPAAAATGGGKEAVGEFADGAGLALGPEIHRFGILAAAIDRLGQEQ